MTPVEAGTINKLEEAGMFRTLVKTDALAVADQTFAVSYFELRTVRGGRRYSFRRHSSFSPVQARQYRSIAQLASVAEKGFDRIGAPTGDDAKLANARGDHAFDDVLKDGLTLDREHRLGDFLGEFLHPGALAGGENDGFHGVRLQIYQTSSHLPA